MPLEKRLWDKSLDKRLWEEEYNRIAKTEEEAQGNKGI
jgi:hypothetical protein